MNQIVPINTGADPDAGDAYPYWQPTEWTSRQRKVALAGLIFLTCSCGVSAWALTVWGIGPLAMDTFFPIGMSLLTVGATLLTDVYWYAYRHAQNAQGDRVSASTALEGMLVFAGLVASITLVIQVIGGILVATVGWDEWRIDRGISYILPLGLGGLVLFVLGISLYNTTWRPTRDPVAPGSAITAPVAGLRLSLRRGVMMVARHSWLLTSGALALSLNLFSEVNLGATDTTVPIQPLIAVFWLGGAYFLVAAVSELRPLPRS